MEKLKRSRLFNRLNSMSIRMTFVLYALFSLLIGIIICILLISMVDRYRINLNYKVKILYFISMKKNRLWSRKFSCHFNGGFEITIKTAVFFCKNENTEGVLKSPFFKDTVVSRRYCHVLFYVPCGAYLCLGRNTVKHSN